MFGRIAVYAHIVVDVIAVGFFGLMFRRNRLAAQRAAVVTQLPSTPSTVQPVFAEDDMSFEDGLVGDSTVVDLSVARQYRKTS